MRPVSENRPPSGSAELVRTTHALPLAYHSPFPGEAMEASDGSPFKEPEKREFEGIEHEFEDIEH
eukprot:8089886-Alexandrium_andersonii.AAC.1